ncbi:MAG: cyclic nucleotide-binding domain-containing protein [Myxococcota bacterium]
MYQAPTRGELKKNLKALKVRLDEHPMDLDARMRIARTHRLLGDKKHAVAHYRAVARYLSLAGQPLMAIGVLKELLQLDPQHEETLHFLAKLYARTTEGPVVSRSEPPAGHEEVEATDSIALPEGLPRSPSGLWYAIRPQETNIQAAVDEESPRISIAEELRQLAAARAESDPSLRAATSLTAEEECNDDDSLPEVDAGEFELLGAASEEEVVLPRVPLFSSLSHHAFVELGHAMVFQRAKPGQLIYAEGDPGDSCIVVASGRARVERTGDDGRAKVLEVLEVGGIAGLFALLSAQARHANLVAETHVEYFEIDHYAVERVIAADPSARESLATLFRERLLTNLFSVMPGFGDLAANDRAEVIARCKDRVYERDDEILWESFEYDGVGILLEGTVRLSERGGSALDHLRLVPGDFFGSFAAQGGGPADLHVVALERVLVTSLSQVALAELQTEFTALRSLRELFVDDGLMLTAHGFAGNDKLPGRKGHRPRRGLGLLSPSPNGT